MMAATAVALLLTAASTEGVNNTANAPYPKANYTDLAHNTTASKAKGFLAASVEDGQYYCDVECKNRGYVGGQCVGVRCDCGLVTDSVLIVAF